MQNLVVFTDRTEKSWMDISMKAGSMFLNRFCIDETAAFELSGVHYLHQGLFEAKGGGIMVGRVKDKGKEY